MIGKYETEAAYFSRLRDRERRQAKVTYHTLCQAEAELTRELIHDTDSQRIEHLQAEVHRLSALYCRQASA